jgi:ubiquitin-protein ligase
MTVVRCKKGRAVLLLGRAQDGTALVYEPRKGAVERTALAAVGLTAKLDEVEQVNVVVVDDSGSMRSVVPELGQRKIAAATLLAQEFIAALKFYNPVSAYGFATFSSAGKLELTSGIPAVPAVEAKGRQSLWRAVGSVLAALKKKTGLANAKKRIFVITDGDVPNEEDRTAVCRDLVTSGVILDAVLLCTTDDNSDQDFRMSVLALSLNSRGCAFCPKSLEEVARFIRKEEFADLAFRRPTVARSSPVPARAFTVATQFLSFTTKVPCDIPYKPGDSLRTLPRALRETPVPHTFCAARILAEMQICAESGFAPYAAADSIRHWRVHIPGPLPGGARTVYWPVIVRFRPDYPYSAPSFHFLALPPLPNVSALGRVRCAALDAYHPRTHIALLLRAIQGLFASADPNAPYSLDSAVERPRWRAEDYDALVAARTRDPPLPLPVLEYLPLIAGEIADAAAPPRPAKNADRAPRVYSQLSCKKIEGSPGLLDGVLIALDEEKYCH